VKASLHNMPALAGVGGGANVAVGAGGGGGESVRPSLRRPCSTNRSGRGWVLVGWRARLAQVTEVSSRPSGAVRGEKTLHVVWNGHTSTQADA